MTYFEKITDDEFGLHLNRRQLEALASVLNGASHPELDAIRKEITHEIQVCNDRIFTEQWAQIEMCGCNGTGKLRVGNLREMHDHDIDKCHKCNGDGSRVKITSVRYEPVSEHWKTILAPHLRGLSREKS